MLNSICISYQRKHKEFGHLEGDTIVGRRHGSAIITLVERVSKMIITLRTLGRKATDIERLASYVPLLVFLLPKFLILLAPFHFIFSYI